MLNNLYYETETLIVITPKVHGLRIAEKLS